MVLEATMAEIDPPPVWGALPVEQYILQNWDATSSLSIDRQRAELVNRYISEDLISPRYYDSTSPDWRIPTEDEISTILQPWRSEKLRAIAAKYHATEGWIDHQKEGFPILRTSYRPGKQGVLDKNKLDQWLGFDELRVDSANSQINAIKSGAELGTIEWLPDSEIEDIFFYRKGAGPDENPPRMHPRNKWWMVLDDEELFNFETQSSATRENKEDSWMRVYEILPEFAAPSMDRRVDVETIRDWVRDRIGDLESAKEDDWEDAVLEVAAGVTGRPFIVVDEETFGSEPLGGDGRNTLEDDMEKAGKEVDGLDEVTVEDDTENEESQVYLLWRDAKGNVIKDTYTDVRMLSWLQDDIGRLLLSEMPLWTESGLGKLYSIYGRKGRIMRKLLGRARSRLPADQSAGAVVASV